VCCIRGADISIVFKPERLQTAISVEGIHGTPENSKVKLDGYGYICICKVYIPVYISKFLSQNIISDGVLMEQGFQLLKSKGEVKIKPPGAQDTWISLLLDPDGRAYVADNVISRPPVISTFAPRNPPIPLDIWHARLGHRSNGYLEAMKRFPQYKESGFNISTKFESKTCEHCLVAKFTRSHFHPPRSRAEEPGRLWYTDVAGGGQRTPSLLYGYVYRTIWVESTTQLKIAMFNDRKNDTATTKNTEFWIKRVLPLFRKESKDDSYLVYLGHDNGEMTSSKIQKLLSSARIISRHTDPYTPQQNGMAERANRYIDEGACTLLTSARLPEAFWAEASRHFCLISNILPWKKNNEYSVDSYQRLHGRAFPYHLLRIWGCKCFVYDQQRDQSNLTPRALRGIYVGMAHDQITAQSWAHRIYIPAQNRFVISGQVHFLENVQRTLEIILPPSYNIDKEKDEFDVNEYDKKLRGVVHLDPEDGIYYVVRQVYEHNGLALVKRLPWPESTNSRLEVVHLRDVLEMLRLEQAAEEAGADIQESGEAAQGHRGTPLPSNPSQVSAEDAPDPESMSRTEHSPISNDSPGRNGSKSSTTPVVLRHEYGRTKRRLESSSGPADGPGPVDGPRSEKDLQRRRSARLTGGNIPRVNLLSSETFQEAQAQRIVDWSLSKNYSLTPHLITPTILSLSPDEEPSSHEEVERHPRRQEWIQGEIKERESVIEAGCLKIVNRSEVPPGRKILRLRWVYKIKRNDKGEPTLYKCRIVVMGNHATQGVDFYETYSPVCKIPSLRLVIALIIHFGLKPCQVDVHTAYLHADLNEDIFVSEMPGYQLPPGKVYKLLKSLYGLPQSGRNWNDLLDSFLKYLGYKPLSEDPCIYVLVENGKIVSLFAVYVDDFVIGSDNISRELWILEGLRRKFKIKELGIPKLVLGITLDWVPSSSNNRFLDHAYLSIPKSVQALLDMMPGGVSSIKVRSTPGNHLITLSKAMCIPDDQQDAQDEDTQSLYRSAVGLLIWIQQTVRYDISYATHRLASFLSNPGPQHFKALYWLAGYLKGSMLRGIKYSYGGNLEISGFVDANHLNDVDDRLSTWCYVFTVNGSPFSWKVGKTKRVCVGGTMESEIRAIDSMKHGIKELLYLKKVFDSLSLSKYVSEMLIGFDPKFPVTIYEDNRATIQMTARPMSHSSVKYLEADMAWIHDHISDGSIILVYVNSPFNLANMGTKYLNPTEFKREVLMSMSDGVYELFPTRPTEEQSEDMKIAILNRNGY
jgi:hypothetical protein